jgi:hypothetical protein
MDCQHSCKSNLAGTMQGVSGLEGPTSLVAAKKEKWKSLKDKDRIMEKFIDCLPFGYVLPELWLLLSPR